MKQAMIILFFLIAVYVDNAMGCNYCQLPQICTEDEEVIQKSDVIFMVNVLMTEGKPIFRFEKLYKGATDGLAPGKIINVVDSRCDEIIFCDSMVQDILPTLGYKLIMFARRETDGKYSLLNDNPCAFGPMTWKVKIDALGKRDIEGTHREAILARDRLEQLIKVMLYYENLDQRDSKLVFDSIKRDLDNKDTLLAAIQYICSPTSIFNKELLAKERILIHYLALTHIDQVIALPSVTIRDIENINMIVMDLPHWLIIKYNLRMLFEKLNENSVLYEHHRSTLVPSVIHFAKEYCSNTFAQKDSPLAKVKHDWDEYITRIDDNCVMGGKIREFPIDKVKIMIILLQCIDELREKWPKGDASQFTSLFEFNISEENCYKDLIEMMKQDIVTMPSIVTPEVIINNFKAEQ